MDKDIAESVKKCLDVIEESMGVLSDLGCDLTDQKEDELVPDMKLHNLYDMTEDVAESAKLRRAQSNLAQRR